MSLEFIKPDYSNDFNYPSLSRKDLMYLDSIKSMDCPIKKINRIDTKRDWSLNLYNLDIERSVPIRKSVFTNKTDFINKIDDIEKARPNKEVILNKPDFILNISDIEKAHPNKNLWNSQRHINPLNPVYKLPSYIKAERAEPRKFIRNQIDISDIEKTKPNKLFPMKMRLFKTYDEIKGVHPKKPYRRKEIHDSLNYSDLNIKNSKFRNTNPLEPEYDNNYGGFIKGTKSDLPYYHFSGKNTLNVEDINGALPGSLNHYADFKYDNKQRFDTRDIDGAYAGTKKYGIKTNRCTNPLQPNYQLIGNNELYDCFGEMINNNEINKKYNTIDASMSKSKLRIIDDYKNKENNNKFNYNNNNNLAYSYKFFNMPPSEKPKRKMKNSMSCEEVKTQLPLLKKNKSKENSIRNNLLDENAKNEIIEKIYEKPFPNYEFQHDSILKFGHLNKNNRLDVKLENNKRNKNPRDLFRHKIIMRNYHDLELNGKNKTHLINNRYYIYDEKKVINNGMGTLYNKLFNDKESNEKKLDNIIKRNDI